ncbi:MAG: NTP transferase domain-containing protein [Candidatus Omnitrophica bacterium]|nr:NTP transferase domain-containing protein [Candidatus Omnitrophota bacterium]
MAQPLVLKKKTKKPVLALVLAAGKGTRMKSSVPKVLHEIGGKPLLGHVLNAVNGADIHKIVVVAGHGEKQVRSFIGNQASVVRQFPQAGTGHAVLCAASALKHFQGLVLILPGDAPGVREETIREMVRIHKQSEAIATVLTACVKVPDGYGRIIRSGDQVAAIREELDAAEEERAICEINSGIYLFEIQVLLKHLRALKQNNRKKEYYLTDVVEALAEEGQIVRGFQVSNEEEVLGINSRVDLARAEKIMNQREIEKHQKNGVTIVSPDNTWIASGVTIGSDTVIFPFSWIESCVKIGSHCHVGPFATIRQGSKIGDQAVVGCFVEVVRSNIGKGSRVKHLTYLGDATLAENVNIGAGTITANYDGVKKQKTVVGKGAFIGSNTVLVAPIRIGQGAKTGAGSVVLGKQHVPAGKTVAGVPAKLIQRKSNSKKKI